MGGIWKALMVLLLANFMFGRVSVGDPAIVYRPGIAGPSGVMEFPEEEPVDWPEATEAPGELHPVVVGDLLLGGSSGGEWLNVMDVAPHLMGGETYNLYSLQGYVGKAIGSAVPEETDDWRAANGPYAEFVELQHGVARDAYVAVNDDWNAMPRVPVAQGDANGTYRAIVNGLLEEEGLFGADIEILQNYRIDLEGDGVDEVVLYAESRLRDEGDWRFFEEKGRFSILILRKVIGGEVQNIVMRSDVHLSEQNFESDERQLREIYPIMGILDLNGDGKLEIVNAFHYYEGFAYGVTDVFDDGSVLVMWNGYGA